MKSLPLRFLTALVVFLSLSSPLILPAACRAEEPPPGAADEQTLKAAGVGTDNAALIEFFRMRAQAADPDKIQALIKQLGDDSFNTRHKATNLLIEIGSAAVPLLRQALADRDLEVVRRAEECLRLIAKDSSTPLTVAAARLLALRKPEGATEVLLAYLPLADDSAVTDYVHTALLAVAVRDGKADPLLVKALEDRLSLRRACAAEILCRAGVAEQRPAVRKLLQDTDATVRLRVALALAPLKEKEAIPALINLLTELPMSQLWQAEEILYRLAEDKAPNLAPGHDSEGRKKYREAWAGWWKEHGDKANLAKLDAKAEPLGYTTIVLLDQGKILDLDAQNKIRWQIGDLRFPLDAQVLSGERVLVAEHGANRVTERNRHGEILWEKAAEEPLVAQRLPNGNTFIGTRSRLFEVDRSGREVFSYHRPDGDLFMKTQKLRNGEIAFVTASQRYIRLDATGKELRSFPVTVSTYGGRIDVLADGNVIVPMKDNNRVLEYDAQGKVVWQVTVEQPVAAVRLPNGNTLITTYNQHRAVELDRNGKEVWRYESNTRVTRAWRR